MNDNVKIRFPWSRSEKCDSCGHVEATVIYEPCDNCGHDVFVGSVGERICDIGDGMGEWTGVTACERCNAPFAWNIPVSIAQ